MVVRTGHSSSESICLCAGSASTPGLLQVPVDQASVVGGRRQDAGRGHLPTHGADTTRGGSCFIRAHDQRYVPTLR